MVALVILAYLVMFILIIAGLFMFWVGIDGTVWWAMPLAFLLFGIAVGIDAAFGDTMMAVL